MQESPDLNPEWFGGRLLSERESYMTLKIRDFACHLFHELEQQCLSSILKEIASV